MAMKRAPETVEAHDALTTYFGLDPEKSGHFEVETEVDEDGQVMVFWKGAGHMPASQAKKIFG